MARNAASLRKTLPPARTSRKGPKRSSPETKRLVADFLAVIERRDAADRAILAALESAADLPSAAHVEQLLRNAAARRQFLKEVPLLSSRDVARLSGSTARNESAKASRWKSDGRIFSVSSRGVDYYPAFQFSSASGEPLPVMRDILEVFRDLSEWQVAFWFWAANVWLNERQPMNIVEREPEAVLDASRHFVEPLDI